MGVLANLREDVVSGLVIASQGHDDWSVLEHPDDGITPPAFVVLWSEPLLEGPQTYCLYRAGIDIRIISTRIEPTAGLDELELMVEAAVAAFTNTQHPIRNVTRPGPYDVDGVRYQSVVASLGELVSIVSTVEAEPPSLQATPQTLAIV